MGWLPAVRAGLQWHRRKSRHSVENMYTLHAAAMLLTSPERCQGVAGPKTLASAWLTEAAVAACPLCCQILQCTVSVRSWHTNAGEIKAPVDRSAQQMVVQVAEHEGYSALVAMHQQYTQKLWSSPRLEEFSCLKQIRKSPMAQNEC